jgi:serine/threonine protein kinase
MRKSNDNSDLSDYISENEGRSLTKTHSPNKSDNKKSPKKDKKQKKHKKIEETPKQLITNGNGSTVKKNPNLYGDRFEIKNQKVIGKGSFGEIYVAQDTKYREKPFVALKLEKAKRKINQLRIESVVLESMKGVEGFSRIYGYGLHIEHHFLAMDILGPNLAELYEYCNNHFSLQTILLIAIQALTRIHDMHSKSYFIHRDIKPENFLIGVDNRSNMIYLVDFGLARKYKDSATHSHIKYREKRVLTGTARYASINSHMGIEQSRRDDLESLGFMLIFFAKKALPWQGIRGSNKREKYNKILDKKMTIPVEVLCKDLPIEFSQYMNYVRNLKFTEKPDYFFLKGIFAELLFTYYMEKFYLDWTLPKPVDVPTNLRINKDISRKDLSNSNANKENVIFLKSEGRRSSENLNSNNKLFFSNKSLIKPLQTNLTNDEDNIKENKLHALAFQSQFNFQSDDEGDGDRDDKDWTPGRVKGGRVFNFNKTDEDLNEEEKEKDESMEVNEDDEEEYLSDKTDENSFFDRDELYTVVDNFYKNNSKTKNVLSEKEKYSAVSSLNTNNIIENKGKISNTLKKIPIKEITKQGNQNMKNSYNLLNSPSTEHDNPFSSNSRFNSNSNLIIVEKDNISNQGDNSSGAYLDVSANSLASPNQQLLPSKNTLQNSLSNILTVKMKKNSLTSSAGGNNNVNTILRKMTPIRRGSSFNEILEDPSEEAPLSQREGKNN